MIRTECDCGRVIKTADKNAGRRMNCPECGEPITLPRAKKRRETGGDTARLPGRRKGVVKKKKKTKPESKAPVKSSDEPDKAMKYLMIFGGVVGVCLIGAMIAFVVNSPGSSSTARKFPKEYEKFEYSAGGIYCQVPKGWEISRGGGSGGKPPYAKFKDDDVRIEIRAAVSGSAIADIGQALSGDDQPDPLNVVHQVHAFRKEQLSAGTDGYTEGEPEVVETAGMGPALIAKYEMQVMISTDYGYRATVLGQHYQFNVTLYCPKAEVERYKPVFVKVVSSME